MNKKICEEYWVIIPFSEKETAERCLKNSGFVGEIVKKATGTFDKELGDIKCQN